MLIQVARNEKNEWRRTPTKLVMSINYFVYISPSKQYSLFERQSMKANRGIVWKVRREKEENVDKCERVAEIL
jgi:hypothetical protein